MFARSLKRCITSLAVIPKSYLCALPKYEEHAVGFSAGPVKDWAKWQSRALVMRDNLVLNADHSKCPKCDGTGYVQCPVCEDGCAHCEGTGIDKCWLCNGTGRMLS